MNAAVPDAEVGGYEHLVAGFSSFGSDAHVVAAAIVGHVDVIVTNNLADFPLDVLQRYNVTAQSADDFLLEQWGLHAATIVSILGEQAAALRHPPMSPLDALERLRQSAPRFAEAVRGEWVRLRPVKNAPPNED